MKKRINGKIKIELLSDLCVGSGYSYAGIVDSDICYDDCGIPYIPARRLKGCMRAAMESVLYTLYDHKETVALFGASGSSDYDVFDNERKITLGNAYIEDYLDIKQRILEEKKEFPLFYNQEQILNRFTHVVGQTEVENGIAKDISLRYTRVVNRYSPLCEEVEPLEFFADITYAQDDEDIIRNVLRTTRNIGLKRNRGMGFVKCTLESVPLVERKTAIRYEYENTNSDYRRIVFSIANVAPLILGSKDEDTTTDYIAGQSMLGLLAGRYLKNYGSAEDQAFKDLFLNGKTKFSNLYPSDGENLFYPAPEYINRLKKTKKYVFTHTKELPKNETPFDDYNYDSGNQPKKLKGKYVYLKEDELSVCEVEKEIIYHNSNVSNPENRLLYSLEAIRPGQLFSGSILVPSEYTDMILKMLTEEDFYFGKSRSVQYGHCVLANDIRVTDSESETVEYKAGDKLLITMLSDMILLNDNRSEYTVYADEILSIIARELFGTDSNTWKQPDMYMSSIQTTIVTGYQGVWNLRRNAVPAIKAGSYCTIELLEGFKPEKFHIGERTLEGFGQIKIDLADKYEYKSIASAKNVEINTGASDISAKNMTEKMKCLMNPIIINEWLIRKISKAIGKEGQSINISNSAVGRWKLMLTECLNNNESSKDALEDLINRIDSIKSEGVKSEGKRIYKTIVTEFGYSLKETVETSNKTATIKHHVVIEEDESKLRSKLLENNDEYAYLNALHDIGYDLDNRNIWQLMRECWHTYLMSIIANRKYEGR